MLLAPEFPLGYVRLLLEPAEAPPEFAAYPLDPTPEIPLETKEFPLITECALEEPPELAAMLSPSEAADSSEGAKESEDAAVLCHEPALEPGDLLELPEDPL